MSQRTVPEVERAQTTRETQVAKWVAFMLDGPASTAQLSAGRCSLHLDELAASERTDTRAPLCTQGQAVRAQPPAPE